MPYEKVKVYSDGSHYIGIPYVPNPYARKKRRPNGKVTDISEVDRAIDIPEHKKETPKEAFDKIYDECKEMKSVERKEYMESKLQPYFEGSGECNEFVGKNLERKKRNLICRKVRMWRKINQQRFNYFVTFTYDDSLHTEDTFRKTLKHCLQHYSSRRGWRYIGVWERSPEKQRLHFHGIFYIPEGELPGENETVTDYDTRNRIMRTTFQNTFFRKRFGRNDFKPIGHESEVPQAVKYLTKYLEKTGEKLVYSRGLYQYFITDIMDEDIICAYGESDRKFVLYDTFGCWDEGVYMGEVSPEVIKKLPKSN